MPITYNGIGTHYYGKKNLQVRPGQCPHCHRNTQLESYDTRLWFVVVFIPVIPLGRKHIIDSCPSCRRHYVSDADKWETAKQLEISGALEKYRAAPTPESAIDVHQRMLNFHQAAEAEEFGRTISTKFADSANVQAYLGSALKHLGRPSDAAAYFDRALRLRPDMPEARVGVAEARIREGNLDDAAKLLAFLTQPGAAQLYSLAPLEMLGRAFQKSGRHEEALATFAKLQEALPNVGENRVFRKLVKTSEKAAGRTGSQLPKQKFSLRRLFRRGGRGSSFSPYVAVAIVGAVVALGFVGANEYIRRHRTVHIVNAFAAPATIEIDGGTPVAGIHGVQTIELAEGSHHAKIVAPVADEFDFNLQTDYFSRWDDDPAWIINVGKAAILTSTTAHYSKNPEPSSTDLHLGSTFEYLPNVTHPFRDLPESIQMNESETRTLVDLQLYKGTGEALINYSLGKNRTGEAMAAAEAWLRTHPDDETVVQEYGMIGRATNATARVDAFLAPGLTPPPVRIAWHRVHQQLHDNVHEHDRLVAQYDALLKADPTNSGLLYLRGRLSAQRGEARDLFAQALRADPKNAYAKYALGYDRMNVGDWPNARRFYAEAVEAGRGDPGFAERLLTARLANGETAAVEKELRQQLAKEPDDSAAAEHLIDVLAMEQRLPEIAKVTAAFDQAMVKYGPNGRSSSLHVLRHAHYVRGDFAALEKTAVNDKSAAGRRLLFEALIEQGRIADATKAVAGQTGQPQDTLSALVLSIAQRKAGDPTAADAMLKQASGLLRQQSFDDAQAANLLDAPQTPTATALQDVLLEPELKAALVAAIISRHPESRPTLLGLVRTFNVDRDFPHHFLERFANENP